MHKETPKSLKVLNHPNYILPLAFIPLSLLLTCSAASGSRWVSSRGTVNCIFLGLPVSMVVLSVKEGDRMKRRGTRRRSKQPVGEKEGKELSDCGWERKISGLQLRKDYCFIVSVWVFSVLYLYLSTQFSLINQLFGTLFQFYSIFFYPQHLLVSLLRLHSPSSLSLPALEAEARAFWARNTSPLLPFAVPDSLSCKSHPLVTFLSICIGCLRSGLFCSSPCTDGRVDDKNIFFLSVYQFGRKDAGSCLCFKRK